jgi:hypothetical protein
LTAGRDVDVNSRYISGPFREFLDSKTVRGATVDRIPLKDLPSFPIKLPPLAALDTLKKALLHQAFTEEL